MYYYFNFYTYAIDFIEANPTAKMIAWPHNKQTDKYVVFVPNEVENRCDHQIKSEYKE